MSSCSICKIDSFPHYFYLLLNLKTIEEKDEPKKNKIPGKFARKRLILILRKVGGNEKFKLQDPNIQKILQRISPV